MRRGLFLKYVVLFVGLVTGVLVINAALDLYFVYQDNRRASIEVQKEKAEAAAQRIEGFVKAIETQMGWVAYAQFASLPVEQRRFDYVRLQRLVPAITELVQIDRDGREQLKVSRLSMDMTGPGADRSTDPAFVEATARKVYFGPVYFRKESEPYLTMAVANGNRGVTVAEINLKLILDVVEAIRIGKQGYAYAVDRQGRLVAHPDISLVLRGTDMGRLPHVASALKGEDSGPLDARNRAGVSVLSAHAAIPALGWQVFVELPTAEAQKPVIDAGLRALGLLVLGLIIAALAGALLARRMLVPIRTLQAGAQRIGSGELGHRLDIKTGDELEALANQFNRSAEALQESYATLEQKVEERTQALTRSVDELTASAEILRLIASAPDHLGPMFETLLAHATRLCGAQFGILWLREEDGMAAAALQNVPEAYADYLHRGPYRFSADTAVGQAMRTLEPTQIADIRDYPGADPMRRATRDLGGARTLVAVPMLRKGEVVGVLAIFRQHVEPFSEAQIKLVQTFGDQAVIAIENARLIAELRETLEQQTATAEILQVISSSPTDVQPVLEAVAKAALRFCGAGDVLIALREGDELVNVAHEGLVIAELGRRRRIERGALSGRAAADGQTVHAPDVLALDDSEFAASRKLAEERGWRAAVVAPMMREDQAIGTILLRKPEPGAFAPRQIQLLEAFAAQAVIAIQNVRLFTELRESLEQQTASAEILEVISQSPTDVQPVLEAVARAAQRFCGAADVSIALREDDEMYYATHVGPLERTIERVPLERGRSSGRAILEGRTIHLHDIDKLDPQEFASAQRLSRQYGFKASLAAPMLREDGAIGCILLRKPEPGPFTERQIELLEAFAAQAVIAIQNVRLFTELRESLEQQTASAEILRVISESPTDVAPVLSAVARAAVRFCGAEDAVIVLRDGDDMQSAAHEGPYRSIVGQRNALDSTRITGRAIVDGRTVHAPDIEALDETEFAATRALARQQEFRAAVAAPMLREGKAIGSIMLRRAEAGPFTPRQIELLEAFAAQAVIAIQNVRLFTEIQEKSRQLEVASQHKSQFLANMSHELRTPLNAIIGYTEMMADGLYGDVSEKAQGVLERVQSNGRHLLGLINDVLDLSKIEAGQLVLAVEEYSVSDMVTTVMSATESLAKAKGIALVSTLPQGLPRGMGDARRLTQVLLNLVGNAIKFTDQGKVEIRARQQGDRFKISVVDTGPGIAKADQAKIFEEFQQVDNTSTRKKGGTGLGLSISRKIVELHGGFITVESDVGKGSNFKITIPINAAPAKEAAQ